MTDAVRIDKWLWAARFYKTRSLAQKQVEGGKVHLEGQRVKPGKTVKPGMTISLRQGNDQRTVVVTALSDRRGSARDAALLYEETAESIAQREANREQRRALATSHVAPDHRPDKKERRDLARFRQRQQH